MNLKDLIAKMDAIEASALSEAGLGQQTKDETFPPLKIGDIDPRNGKKILSALTSSDGTVVRSRFGDIWNVKYGEPDTPAPTPAPVPTPAEPGADAGPPDSSQDANPSTNFNMDWQPMIDRLNQLLDQLEDDRGQGPNPTPTPKPKPKVKSTTGIQPAVGVKPISNKNFNQNQNDTLNLLAAGGMGAESKDNSDKSMLESQPNLAKKLIESFGYELDEISDELAAGGAAYAAANPLEKKLAGTAASTAGKSFAGKAAAKLLPGVATAIGTADAIHRYKQGDYLGAGIAGTSAAVSLVPGLGWIPALALDAFNLGRDLSSMPKASPEVAAKNPPQGDTPVKQLQRVIGTKDDGIFGKNSQAALKAWQQSKGMQPTGQPTPDVFKAAGVRLSEQYTRVKTTAELIAETQRKLELLSDPDPVIYMCEDGSLFAVDINENVVDLSEAGILATGAEKAIPYAKQLFKAKPANPNAAFKEIPGAPAVTKDLTGAPVAKAGEISATGAVGAKRAQSAADAALANQRAASATAQKSVDDMIRAGKTTPAKPGYSAGPSAKVSNAPAGMTPAGAGLPKGITIGKLGAAEEKGVAALTKAEQTAVKTGVEAMTPAAKANWIKRYPKTAAALGILAGGIAGYMFGKDERGVDPNPTPGPTPGPTPTPTPSPAQKPEMDEINELLSKIANAEDPAVQQQLQTARIRLSRILKDPNIGKAGTGEATPPITIPGSSGQGANPTTAPVTI